VAPLPFATIHEAALARHGEMAIEARLVTPRTEAELEAVADDRYLSLISRRVFRAGLRHELVDPKWPAFEEVFHGFDPGLCARLPDEALEAMLEDKRLIRHMPKLRAVRANAKATLDIVSETGSVGRWLATWPTTRIVGLWTELAKRFSQMGGNSGPAFLRMAGKDTFMLTDSVVGALRRFELVDVRPTTRADRAAVQEIFNGWAAETGRPLCQLSQILAMASD
jgi:3-methyladenine DNA glycosylase Tag